MWDADEEEIYIREEKKMVLSWFTDPYIIQANRATSVCLSPSV